MNSKYIKTIDIQNCIHLVGNCNPQDSNVFHPQVI